MLQQTKVQTVIPYFERFIKKFPTIQALALAEEDELLKLWEGLGYYNRVRNLQKATRQIIENFNGVMPENIYELESLSGVGPYTAGAISSIAFNHKHSAVDGNVLRVFSRLLEINEDIKNPKVKKDIKEYVESVLPESRIGDFNQGLMEIGAIICLPNGAPHCLDCPFNKYCLSYKNNSTSEIPLKRMKKKVPQEKKTVFIIEYDNHYAIEKRNKNGLLASMYQFPMVDSFVSYKYIKSNILGKIKKIEKLGEFIHKFSHKEWLMKGYFIKLDTNQTNYDFVSYNEIESKYTIPSAFKKFKEIARKKANE
jgi:A/G-specific adenine glycosylase